MTSLPTESKNIRYDHIIHIFSDLIFTIPNVHKQELTLEQKVPLTLYGGEDRNLSRPKQRKKIKHSMNLLLKLFKNSQRNMCI